jgi:hypothetical protein
VVIFLKWFFAGQREIPKLLRMQNQFKKRADGFLFCGVDTFTAALTPIVEANPEIKYHESKARLGVNSVDLSKLGFSFTLDLKAYSPQVLEVKKEMSELHHLDFATQKYGKTFVQFAFKP